MLYLLDYGAGNVRSLANSIEKLGFQFRWVESASDLSNATALVFPGVGAFGQAMESLHSKGYSSALKSYIESGKPYYGICIGMQTLFLSSEEDPVDGLGVIPASITRFCSTSKSVPHIGWNGASAFFEDAPSGEEEKYYFVHSYKATFAAEEEWAKNWTATITRYGDEDFVSSVQRGNVFATQFHPEKSGKAGLELLDQWLRKASSLEPRRLKEIPSITTRKPLPDLNGRLQRNGLTKRVVAALDVRTNDEGDLVVTKGDQYDVRDKSTSNLGSNAVRNLGKPVDLAKRYYEEGADEICFLNITSFRSCPLADQPMLDVVRLAAQEVFIPLTIGGGIRDTVDPDGKKTSALEVAGMYFRQGADKVSIGSDAVEA
ncbi:imidazole glycerol pho, partial [Atractiella rhizophila]